MKTVLLAVVLSVFVVTGAPTFPSQPSEHVKQMNERAQKNSINSIKTFLPYLYEELDKRQSELDRLKQEDPTNVEAILTAEQMVKKQQDYIASREQKLAELQATTSNN